MVFEWRTTDFDPLRGVAWFSQAFSVFPSKIVKNVPLPGMAGSAINGPVAKECADLWPRIASNAGSIV